MVKIPKDKKGQQKFLIKALLLFTVLYICLCMTKQNYFKKMLNTLLGRSETFVNQLGGSGRYHKLTDSDTVESVISQHSGNECTIVAVTAEWCGYCKKLYESGELQKAAKTHLVVVVDEKHKQAEKIMKETGSGGFPTIAIHCKQRGFGKYEGPRTAKAMIAACSCNSVKSSDTNPQIIKVSNKENPIESAKTVCRETGKGVLICLLADWCGHCKRLKESGELDKVAMTNPVMIVSDENEHTSSIMNEYKSRGFPTLLTMKKSGMIKSYDGQRMSQEIVKSL
jgi:thiol-disulfide isomerase/thioredoxin